MADTTVHITKETRQLLKIEAAKRQTTLKDLLATCVAVALDGTQEDTHSEVPTDNAA
jgi:hypothetical protein